MHLSIQPLSKPIIIVVIIIIVTKNLTFTMYKLCANILRWSNKCLIGIPEESRENWGSVIFKELTQNFLELLNDMDPQIQESQIKMNSPQDKLSWKQKAKA